MLLSRASLRVVIAGWVGLMLVAGWAMANEESSVRDWMPDWLQPAGDTPELIQFQHGGTDALFGIPLAEVADDLLLEQIDALQLQRPGHVDLYAIGVAGDASEAVFANEVHHFTALMTHRFGAQGRTLALMNRSRDRQRREQLPIPQAHLTNLRAALQGVGQRMDPAEDLLLLYLTMHGTDDPLLHLQLADGSRQTWSPQELRDALDDAGIRNRIVVLSACYSGGFEPELANEHTLLITAARADRPSFGCGSESTITWFGRGWLLEGLSRHADPVQAFRHADRRIRRWEAVHEQEGSHPQLWLGKAIQAPLAAWQARLQAGRAPLYWYPLDDPDTPDAAEVLPADTPKSPKR